MELPKRLDFSQQDIEALFKRLEANQLEDADRDLLKQVCPSGERAWQAAKNLLSDS